MNVRQFIRPESEFRAAAGSIAGTATALSCDWEIAQGTIEPNGERPSQSEGLSPFTLGGHLKPGHVWPLEMRPKAAV